MLALAVIFVNCRLVPRRQADTHRLLLQSRGTLTHLRPLLVVPGDLGGAVPGEVACDAFPHDDFAHEVLVVFGEPPDAACDVLAISARRRHEVFRDACEEEPSVAPARRFGDRAGLEDDNMCAAARQVIRGRGAGDARADDRDVRGDVLIKGRVDIGRDFVEPDACHSWTYSCRGGASWRWIASMSSHAFSREMKPSRNSKTCSSRKRTGRPYPSRSYGRPWAYP